MKRLLQLTIGAALGMLTIVATSTEPASVQAQIGAKGGKYDALRQWPNYAFNVGEKLTFDISYGVITAGEAVMEVPMMRTINDRRVYEVNVKAKSLPSFDWVFKVRDRYTTYIDEQGIFPWRFDQVVREGKYSRDFSANFDPITKTAITTDKKTHVTPAYVHDIVSAFYYVRTLDLAKAKKGEVIKLENFYKDRSHPLNIKVLGRQRIETAAGTFNTIVLEPMVVEGGLFKNEGSIKIWLTDDYNKMPVKMSTKILIGSIDAELAKYEGVRNPLAAKVK
jgi:hypothetical protein